MKNFVIVVSLFLMGGIVFLVLQANKNQAGPGELMIDSFEGPISRATVDYGSSATSRLEVTGSRFEKACGWQALKLSYSLKPEGYLYCARGKGLKFAPENGKTETHSWTIDPDKIEWDKYEGFSFHMKGAKTGQVAFDVKDNSGELWRYMIEDDFDDWQAIQIPFLYFAPRTDWQPDEAVRNGTLDFPLKSYQVEPKTVGEGTLYFDCIKLVGE